MAAQEWIGLHDQTLQLLRALESELSDMARRGGAAARQRRQVKQKLATGSNNVAALERILDTQRSDPGRYMIGDGELSRRQDLLLALKTQLRKVEDLHAAASGGGSGSPGAAGGGSAAYGQLVGAGASRYRPAEEDEESRLQSNAQLLETQEARMKRQDEDLDVILGGVRRLKHIGQDIDEELGLQNRLLDDLDQHVDRTDARVLDNISSVDYIADKSKNCCGIVCMLLLLVVIVVLLIIPCKSLRGADNC